MLVAQGEGGAALAAYRAGLAIAERLAAADPGNAGWQRDLSVSHERIGDVLVAQGELRGRRSRPTGGPRHRASAGRARPGQHRVAARPLGQPRAGSATCWRRRASCAAALAAYQAGLAIARAAGRARPGQHRVAARPLGQPQQDRRRAGARRATGRGRSQAYQAAPRHRRAAGRAPTRATPSGSATSRSATTRSATCWSAQGDCAGALAGLPGRPRHRARSWPRTTRATPSGSATSRSATTRSATCCARRATRRRARGLSGRPGHRRDAGRRDPGNTEWQRDLSVSHDRIGDVLVAQGDGRGALAGLPGRPRHPRAAGRRRPGQRRMAARPDRLLRQAGRSRAGHRAPFAGSCSRCRPRPERGWPFGAARRLDAGGTRTAIARTGQ